MSASFRWLTGSWRRKKGAEEPRLEDLVRPEWLQALLGSSDLQSGAPAEVAALLQRNLAAEGGHATKAAEAVPNEIAAGKVLVQPPPLPSRKSPGSGDDSSSQQAAHAHAEQRPAQQQQQQNKRRGRTQQAQAQAQRSLAQVQRPLVVVTVSKHFPGDRLRELERFVVLVLDTAAHYAAAAADGQLAALFDLRDVTMRNLHLGAIRVVFSTLERHFPERLSAIYLLDASWVFHGAWHLIEPFIDAGSRKKVRFVSGSAGRATLLEELGPDVVPADECGPSPGTCKRCAEFVSDLWPHVKPDFAIYRTADGQCTKCKESRSAGVVKCGAQGRTTKCGNGYALSTSGGAPRCMQCKSGGSYCATCDLATLKCRACQEGYGFNPWGTCVRCRDSSCSVCRDFRACDRCQSDSYYLDPATKACKYCDADGCDVCNPDGTCKKCYGDGYNLVGGKCVPCPDSCDKCTPAGVCTKCQDGFLLAGGKCQECGPGCEKCSSKAVCSKCFSASLTNGKCTRCADPRCNPTACPGNPGICRKCQEAGYQVDPATGRCVPVPGTQSASAAAADAAMAAAAAEAAATATGGGDGISGQIVGGYDARRGRYPWMASLRANSKADMYAHGCGASLVHERVLLTAAHCLVDGGNTWRDIQYAFPQVRVGGYWTNGGIYQLRRAAWPLVHEAFNGDTTDGHDFALILLDRPVAQGTPLVQLPAPGGPNPPVPPGTMLYAIGWGNLGYHVEDNEAKCLMEVPLKLLPKAVCKYHYNDTNLETDTQLCAGEPKAHKDTCQGDSGGPLFVKGRTNATDFQIGITSWGKGCAEKDPGVYSSVAWAAGWIRQGTDYLLREADSGRIPGVPAKAAGR
ncbi:hypothetical protein ABPG75_003075 [Micractinium tetrahymenae]